MWTDDGVVDGKILVTNDFVPPLPEGAPPPPPPPPPPPQHDSSEKIEQFHLSEVLPKDHEENSASLSAINFSRVNSCSEFSSGASSPSLAELVELQKKLVMQLKDNTDDELFSNPLPEDELSKEEDDKSSDSLCILDECGASDDSNQSIQKDTISDENKADLPINPDSLPRTPSQSKSVVLGTPSLATHSPYTKLPAFEKFSKDVSEHINFENLPGATGSYEKVKNSLKRVRAKLSSIMK